MRVKLRQSHDNIVLIPVQRARLCVSTTTENPRVRRGARGGVGLALHVYSSTPLISIPSSKTLLGWPRLLQLLQTALFVFNLCVILLDTWTPTPPHQSLLAGQRACRDCCSRADPCSSTSMRKCELVHSAGYPPNAWGTE